MHASFALIMTIMIHRYLYLASTLFCAAFNGCYPKEIICSLLVCAVAHGVPAILQDSVAKTLVGNL